MSYLYDESSIGIKVIAKQGYDGNDKIKKKCGTIIEKNKTRDGLETITVFFHENIDGHEGNNFNKTYDMRKILAEKYNVSEDNCWSFYGKGIGDSLMMLDKKTKMKVELMEVALVV